MAHLEAVEILEGRQNLSAPAPPRLERDLPTVLLRLLYLPQELLEAAGAHVLGDQHHAGLHIFFAFILGFPFISPVLVELDYIGMVDQS